MFDYRAFNLPVDEVIPEIKNKLATTNTLLLQAPPGAGKSTLIPLALLDAPWLKKKKIVMLEPRRLAAKTIAARMAAMLGEETGATVGYRIRFENKISSATRIEVVTEGVLTRMIQHDNSLEDVALLIFDEFHERNLHADLALALSRETQQILRPDLRIMLMSATLEIPMLSSAIHAAVVESTGKQFPVQIMYGTDADVQALPECTALAVKQIAQQQEGDMLVFLPGQSEIHKCAEVLGKSLKGVSVVPLYGQLSPKEQQFAILPDRSGRRKVVLATNIAETSLTIEGIRIVVDSGFERRAVFDPATGLSRLITTRISRQSADQRAGRAGRLTPGFCYRMWSPATHTRLEQYRPPEMEYADLTRLVLELAHWGNSDVETLTWITHPPATSIQRATELLHHLEALENNRITEHGRHLHRLPTHPRIAHMLIRAQQNNQLPLATDIAPLLEERDPLSGETGIDITLRIEALRRFRKEKNGSARLIQIEKLAAQYRDLFGIEADNGEIYPYEIGELIAYAYPERIGCARPGKQAQFQMANGKMAMVHHQDTLAHEPWLAIAHVSERDNKGKIFLAAPLNPQDLAHMVKTKDLIIWDTRKGGIVAQRELRIGTLVLSSTPLHEPDTDCLIAAICEAIKKEGNLLLKWNEETAQLQNRILSLKTWRAHESWPDMRKETLLLACEKWLAPFLQHVKTTDDLKKLNLKSILLATLTSTQQQQLSRLAPEFVQVPSGSRIPLRYQADGSPPVLSVRLQECFGMKTSPTVNEGQIPVLVELLSPGFKPVQTTRDMSNFWRQTYFEVRKELKQRYPKHYWPDNPEEAEAVRGVKRKSFRP
ncbi:MAG: ATP-dependent helicase HrpB [Chitinophagales bacterium]|nr:MAG: ATP-dependent helicase HrpB [Chitinophagales bacterium]